MSRQPVPGSDAGTWGTILNDYLSVSLDTDGTIKSAALSAKNVELTTNKDTDGTLAANSDTKYPSQKATKTYADTKIASTYLDTDGTLTANSDTKIATQKATKTYVDTGLAAKASKDIVVKILPSSRVSSGTVMTPLVPVNGTPGTPIAIPAGTMMLAYSYFESTTITSLGVLVSASSLTAGQVLKIVLYNVATDGFPGTVAWSQDITVGTSTGTITASSLSLAVPSGGAYVGILNPSTNAGTCTVRVGTVTASSPRAIVSMSNTSWNQVFDVTSLSAAPDLTSYKFRFGSISATLNIGNYTAFPIIGANS